METQKNREIENVNEMKEDSNKTESVDSENSQQSLVLPTFSLDKNVFSNFSTNFTMMSGKKKRRSLHSTFLLLKERLNLTDFMRKTQIDSLLKKCKSKAFKTIHEALKKCLNIKLPRLPQHFITNIKIDFNKIYLEKSILEIYQEQKIITSIEEFVQKKYLIEDKIQVFRDFLSLTFRNVFEYYVNSKQYVKDYYHIQQREGEKFAILFNYISKIFVQYYTKSKGNRPKGPKRNENDMENSNSDNMDENITNINLEENLMSTNELINKKRRREVTHQIKRKPVFKRIKVKRVPLKKKIVKVCEVSQGSPIFEIKKSNKKERNLSLNFNQPEIINV